MLIHYFSGTGNAERAAQHLAKSLPGKILVHSIESGLPQEIEKAKYHIFLFPVYATFVPHIMRQYMAHLPRQNYVPAAVIPVHGEINQKKTIPGHIGVAAEWARWLLIRRGYKVAYTNKIGYPANISIAGILPKPAAIVALLKAGDVQAEKIAEDITQQKKSLLKYPLVLYFACILFGVAFDLLGRRWIGKLYVADHHCTRCGICIKNCPAKAISLQKNQPRWNYQCEGCLRCFNRCPQKAIQVSCWRILISCYPPLFFIQVPLHLGLFSAFTEWFIRVWILDQGLFHLEAYQPLNKLLGWSFSNTLKRYNP